MYKIMLSRDRCVELSVSVQNYAELEELCGTKGVVWRCAKLCGVKGVRWSYWICAIICGFRRAKWSCA